MKKNQVCIVGCGWLGKPLAIKLKSEFKSVIASTTSAHAASEFEQAGITHMSFDMNDFTPEQIAPIKLSDVIILSIPASKIELIKLQAFIASLELKSDQKFILISSTSVYKNSERAIAESDISTLDPNSHPFLIEKIISYTPNHVILRMAGLIGPGRHPVKFINSSKVLNSPDSSINFICQPDAIEIVKLFSMNDISNEIYNCVGDEHFSKRDFYSRLALEHNQPEPVFKDTGATGSKLVSNEKLKSKLHFKFTPLLPYLSQLVFN